MHLQLVEIHHERVNIISGGGESAARLPSLPRLGFSFGSREGDEVRLRCVEHVLQKLVLSIFRLDEFGESGSTLSEQVEVSGQSGEASVQLADRIRRRRRRELLQGGVDARERSRQIVANLRQPARAEKESQSHAPWIGSVY